MPDLIKATQENMRAVLDWQAAGFVHPLTCGKDSSHADLLPSVTRDGDLELCCVTCNYRQTFIPPSVVSPETKIYLDKMRKALNPDPKPT